MVAWERDARGSGPARTVGRGVTLRRTAALYGSPAAAAQGRRGRSPVWEGAAIVAVVLRHARLRLGRSPVWLGLAGLVLAAGAAALLSVHPGGEPGGPVGNGCTTAATDCRLGSQPVRSTTTGRVDHPVADGRREGLTAATGVPFQR